MTNADIFVEVIRLGEQIGMVSDSHMYAGDYFTVEGKKLDSYKADVDDFGDYVTDTEVISDGYFHESEKRSAPYFDIQIDGIKLLNTKF